MTLSRCAVLILTVCVVPVTAGAQSAIERFVADENPCRHLKVEVDVPLIGRHTIGIDRLDDVAIDTVELRLEEDRLDANIAGRLACRTSRNALIEQTVSARFNAYAEADLATCTLESLDLSDVEFGGDAAALLNPVWPFAVGEIRRAASDRFAKECQRLLGPR